MYVFPMVGLVKAAGSPAIQTSKFKINVHPWLTAAAGAFIFFSTFFSDARRHGACSPTECCQQRRECLAATVCKDLGSLAHHSLPFFFDGVRI